VPEVAEEVKIGSMANEYYELMANYLLCYRRLIHTTFELPGEIYSGDIAFLQVAIHSI
jgi:hypothetical protein